MIHKIKMSGQSAKEEAKRLVDLFFVSVLLDAGAGDRWRFVEPGSEAIFTRSEGIAIASLHMYLNGSFSTVSSSRKDIVLGTPIYGSCPLIMC